MTQNQPITIELFGIPRLRAGVSDFVIEMPVPCRLADVFKEIRLSRPQLGSELFIDGKLKPEFIANVSGEKFTRSLEQEIVANDSVLILSSDAGG